MLTYDEAVARIVGSISALPAESRPLLKSLGCVLAEDIFSPIDIPSFDNSSMDGYAVIAADTVGATPDHPVTLHVEEVIATGSMPRQVIAHEQASRIFTGAPMPLGADAVVPVEDTLEASADFARIAMSVQSGENVRRAGSDIARGDVGLNAGHVVRPIEIGVAASMGYVHLPVYRSPEVAIITTGNELVQPGSDLQRGKIYNNNSLALQAKVIAAGCEVLSVHHAADNLAALKFAFSEARAGDADVIISSGGVSVGDYDFVKQAVLELGGEIDFWKVAIRPGKPFVFGHLGNSIFLGLPGNPVSTFITFELFAKPTLKRLAGYPAELCVRQPVNALLKQSAEHEPGRRSFQRAWTRIEDGRFVTEPIGGQSSHQMRSMAHANSLLILLETVAELPAGSIASVILLD